MKKERYRGERTPHKKKKSHRLYAAIVLTLGIIIISLAVLLLFYVQRIEIKGNLYCKDETIVSAIQNDKFSSNSLYVLAKYEMGKGEIPQGLESMSVTLKNPWTLSVSVVEKQSVGYFEYKKQRVYFDDEGVVLINGMAVVRDVPRVEGARFKNVKLFQKLECENSNIFKEIALVTREIKKQELLVDKIEYINDRMYLYTGTICVSIGMDVTPEKIAQIKPIYEKLKEQEEPEKQEGTLHLENYSAGNETITFAIGEFPKEN